MYGDQTASRVDRLLVANSGIFYWPKGIVLSMIEPIQFNGFDAPEQIRSTHPSLEWEGELAVWHFALLVTSAPHQLSHGSSSGATVPPNTLSTAYHRPHTSHRLRTRFPRAQNCPVLPMMSIIPESKASHHLHCALICLLVNTILLLPSKKQPFIRLARRSKTSCARKPNTSIPSLNTAA